MGITVAGPCFESENDPSPEFCARRMVRFELVLHGLASAPQTDCSADVKGTTWTPFRDEMGVSFTKAFKWYLLEGS